MQQQQLVPHNGNAAPMAALQPVKPGMMLVPAHNAAELQLHQNQGSHRNMVGRPQVAPGLVNDPTRAVQLPCMMQMEFAHTQFGHCQVWALLLWVDDCERSAEDARKLSQRNESSESLRDRFVGKRGLCIQERKLFIHRIEHITPIGSPLAAYVGQYFSSLFASADLLAGKKRALDAWHLVHQPHVNLASVIAEQGFCPTNWSQSLSSADARRRDVLSDSTDETDQPRLRLSMIVSDAEIAQLMEEEGPATNEIHGRVPAWVHTRDKGTFRRCHRFLGDITLRDCLASQCDLECNELQCMIDKILPGQSHMCAHGVSHTPYEALRPLTNVVERERVCEEKRIITKTTTVVEELEPLQLVPRRVTASMSNDSKAQRALRNTTRWERRIRFEYIRTNDQLDLTRRFCKHLSRLIVQFYIHTDTAGSMCSSGCARALAVRSLCQAVDAERVLDSSAKLDELLRYGVWHPQSAVVSVGEAHAHDRSGTIPIECVFSQQLGSAHNGLNVPAPFLHNKRVQRRLTMTSFALTELSQRLDMPPQRLLPEIAQLAR
jgi:hypothetical protein